MCSLSDMITRVERAQGECNGLVRDACMRNERSIIDMNIEQLNHGLNADGELMNDGMYSPSWMKKRAMRGLPTDHVYLMYEGGLQGGMKVNFGESGMSVQTDDWKQSLVDIVMSTRYWPPTSHQTEYGPVFGLTSENKVRLSDMIKPIIIDEIRSILKGS